MSVNGQLMRIRALIARPPLSRARNARSADPGFEGAVELELRVEGDAEIHGMGVGELQAPLDPRRPFNLLDTAARAHNARVPSFWSSKRDE